jgi:hypothetical protein
LPKDEAQLCPNCPLSPYWQAEVLKELREKQQQYHRVSRSSYYGTTNLTHGVEEPSAYKICLARRVKLKELGQQCPYFPETEDISRFAIAQEEEAKAETVEAIVEEEPVTEAVNPLRTLTYRKPRRQTLIIERRGGTSYLESARKFYKTGLLRCPNCGSFRVSGLDPDKKTRFCLVCNYTFPEAILEEST